MTSHTQNKPDPLRQYTSTVVNLHGKLDRVYSNQQAVADSLSRAAAALRSISEVRERI